MQFESFLDSADFILAEGSVYERLRRHPSVRFDPYLAHASLIYDPASLEVLEQVHREYLEVGVHYNLPMTMLTDTWRANQERLNLSQYRGLKVNQANARVLQNLRAAYESQDRPIFIGGNIGPKGDAYLAEQALTRFEATRFHSFQIQALVEGGVDYLIASTLPAFPEALGIAEAMAATHLPYLLSFIIRSNGALLDGIPLDQAIREIDEALDRPPTGYAVNCVHPSILKEGLRQLENQRHMLNGRILYFQANASDKTPEELAELIDLEAEEPESLAESIWEVHKLFGIPILGGCCGASTQHIEYLARKYRSPANQAL